MKNIKTWGIIIIIFKQIISVANILNKLTFFIKLKLISKIISSTLLSNIFCNCKFLLSKKK